MANKIRMCALTLLHGLRTCRPKGNFVKIASAPEPLRQFSSGKIDIDSVSNKATAESQFDDQKYEDNIRVAVLTSALTFIDRHGWSTDAIVAGAEAIGYPGTVHGLFQNGAGDLISFVSSKCNRELVEQMKTWPAPSTDSQKVPIEFLEKAIMTRLLMIEPFKKIWAKAIAIQAMPGNIKTELSSTLHLVDDICYFSGDRSVDINWYTRRLGLVGIYKATELFFLTDESRDYNATRQFLTARLKDAEFLQSTLNLGSNTAPTLPLISALATTAKNILGINRGPSITKKVIINSI